MEDTPKPEQRWVDDAATDEEIRELAQRVEKEEGQRDRARPPAEERKPSALRRFFSSPVVAVALALMALILTVLNILGIPPFGFRGERITPAEINQRLEATLRFAKEEILAFEAEKGRLPHDLGEVNLEGANVEYEPLPDGGFRLRVQEAGKSLESTVAPPPAPQGGGDR